MRTKKLNKVTQILQAENRAAIAFSGGADSALLLCLAAEALGTDRVLALTARAPVFPQSETQDAARFAQKLSINHLFCDVDVLAVEGFAQNPENRCYVCKKHLMSQLLQTAREHGYAVLFEGSNADDLQDYRPGHAAVKELQIQSPLQEAELTKAEIRQALEERGLAVARKPAMACLATRIPYGQTITESLLFQIEQAEDFLRSLGFSQVRARTQTVGENTDIRIEVLPEQLSLAIQNEIRGKIYTKCKQIGFANVSLDLQGYRMGGGFAPVNIES